MVITRLNFLILYLLLSIENEHFGSSNGNMCRLPWQDNIK